MFLACLEVCSKLKKAAQSAAFLFRQPVIALG